MFVVALAGLFRTLVYFEGLVSFLFFLVLFTFILVIMLLCILALKFLYRMACSSIFFTHCLLDFLQSFTLWAFQNCILRSLPDHLFCRDNFFLVYYLSLLNKAYLASSYLFIPFLIHLFSFNHRFSCCCSFCTKINIFLSQPTHCWDSRVEPPCLILPAFFYVFCNLYC